MGDSEVKRRGDLPQPGADRDNDVFARARVHSRRVRFLRIFFPAAALICAFLFSWFTFFAAPKTVKSGANADVGSMETGDKLVMTAPKVEGYTKDNRPYSIKAEKAMQDPASPSLIELRNISGSVPLGNRGNAKVEAEAALFDNVSGRLSFSRPFTVITADNIRVRLLSADVNIQSGQMMTSDKVEIRGPTQYIEAASMRIAERGRVMYLSGRVHIVINGQNAADKNSGGK